MLPAPAEVETSPMTARPSRRPQRAHELFPDFATTMPMLKEMLLASANTQVSVQ